MSEENKQNKICYWCGNTGITWYNTRDGLLGEWGECVNHEYRNNELSEYAKEILKKNEN